MQDFNPSRRLSERHFGLISRLMARKLTQPKTWFKRAPVIPVIRLYGAIAPGRGSPLGGRTLSHPPLEKAIEEAFSSKKTKAVALAINSPGGAPGQSSLIARHIRRLADEKNIPVLAFCEDVAASGGYLLACAADEIFVNEYSVMGSIGVISAGFGAKEAIDKLGIERRVYTAGKRKLLLDTFGEEDPEDVARLKALQGDIHARFIDWVKASRKDRINPEDELFEGDVWVGQKAVDIGLADGVGEMRDVLRGRFGDEIRLKDIGPGKSSLIGRLLGSSEAHGGTIGGDFAETGAALIEERLIWARYGL